MKQSINKTISSILMARDTDSTSFYSIRFYASLENPIT